MPLKIVTPPEAVLSTAPLSDVENHLRIDAIAEGAALNVYAKAAAQHAQEFTRRGIGSQVWDLLLDAFPAGPINLPLPPLQSVASITYVDTNGVTQTWAAEDYTVDAVSGRIFPAYGRWYPATRNVPNAVTVRFTCGYPAANVPESIRAAMLLLVGDLYENREGQSDRPFHTNKTVERLLWPYRVF